MCFVLSSHTLSHSLSLSLSLFSANEAFFSPLVAWPLTEFRSLSLSLSLSLSSHHPFSQKFVFEQKALSLDINRLTLSSFLAFLRFLTPTLGFLASEGLLVPPPETGHSPQSL